MANRFMERVTSAWNVFRDKKEEVEDYSRSSYSYSSGSSASRFVRSTTPGDQKIVNSIYNRIAVDVAAISLHHVRTDENDRYLEEMPSDLNYCLTVEANVDQAATAFKIDIAMSTMQTGCIAIVPVDTTLNPEQTAGFDIRTMRVGYITQWYPQKVRVKLLDDRTGEHKEVVLSKKQVAIVENPFFSVMNDTNSTLQRLLRKLSYLDAIDKQSASGKLDIIIQLPYVLKNQAKKDAADERRKDIEMQLSGSQYGIAYTDATEKVIQLNRPAENNLLKQIQFLTEQLYSELGLTKEIMNGTANEETMLNYNNRTVQPFIVAITEAMSRSFLSKTARTQHQAIMYFRDPFALVPISSIADIADKFTRNEILSSNEVRGLIGFKPSKDPKADELRNKNIPEPTPTEEVVQPPNQSEPEEVPETEPKENSQNGS